MKILTRLFGPIKPINTSHELELLVLAELDVLCRIDKLGKELANQYLEKRFGIAAQLATTLARTYEELFICLNRTEECRAKLIRERQAPQSKKIDYTRYDENTY